MRILVAEDHPMLGHNLKKGLESCDYTIDLVKSGEETLALVSENEYSLIILDIMLPGPSVCDICLQLRTQKPTTPILFLTALNRVDHQVMGLDLEADDYLIKPFAFCELEMRVRALLKHDDAPLAPILRFMDITLDTQTREVRRGQRTLTLSSKEYALLDFLMRYPRHILSRAMIAEHLWDYSADHLSNVIDIYIRYLRTKLCAEGESNVIQTIHGTGYQLRE
jgi:DNA-binding response OmpR family regulator